MNDTFYPAYQNDDGWINKEYLDGELQTSSGNYASGLQLGDWAYDDGGLKYLYLYYTFLLFRNVDIKPNSVINSATIRLYLNNNFDEDYDGIVRVYFEDDANPDQISSIEDFNNLELTEEYTDKTLDDVNAADLSWVTFDVTDILQYMVNREDWVRGNNVMSIFHSFENAYSLPYDADFYLDDFDDYYSSGNTPELVVDWTEPLLVPTDLLSFTHFYDNRLQTFEYELLSLTGGGVYKTAGLLSTVKRNTGRIGVDFERRVIGDISFNMVYNNDINYASDIVRPWFIVNGNRYPMGAYFLIEPDDLISKTKVNQTIKGTDLLQALEDDTIEESYVADAGENVIDLVVDLLESVGSWVQYELQDSSEVLAEDKVYAIGKSKLFIINRLLENINYYPLWCNGYGVFKALEWSAAPQVTWVFGNDSQGLYDPNFLRTRKFAEIYNKVTLVANQLDPDTAPLKTTLTMEDVGLENHPLSYTSIQRYRHKQFDSEATSLDYLEKRATKLLYEMLGRNEDITFNHAFVTKRKDGFPTPGDSYKFINTRNSIEGVYAITKQSIDLKYNGLVNTLMRQRQVISV